MSARTRTHAAVVSLIRILRYVKLLLIRVVSIFVDVAVSLNHEFNLIPNEIKSFNVNHPDIDLRSDVLAVYQRIDSNLLIFV